MPTLPYLTDTSTQLSGTYTTSTAALDNYATSNYINSFWTTSPTSNNWIYLNKPVKVGRVGIGITNNLTGALELSNDINPQLSTSIKIKFGCFSANASQGANQIFTTTCFRMLSADTYNEILELGYVSNYDDPSPRTYVMLVTRTALTMTGDGSFSGNFAIGTTPGTYKLNVNGSINSTSFYQNGTLINFSSYATNTNLTTNYYNITAINNLLATKQPNLTVSTTLLGTGGSITGINYNTVINKPSYSLPLSSNATTNEISINLGSYSTTGTDTNYVLKTGGTMTGALTVPNITLGSGGKINSYDDYHYIQISQPTDTLTIQEFGKIVFSIGQTKTEVARINSTGLTVYGICTATTFAGSGASLTNVPYTALTGTVPFYTKGEEDALLNAKQPNLTAATTLLGTGGSITGINYNTVINKPSYTSPISSNATTNTISIDLSSYALNTTLTTVQTNNSNYASNISNVLLINYNSLNTTTNINNSNYASNISNILTIRDAANLTTVLTNNSNYASNISNVLLINYNSLNTTTNINNSNYASNISNVLNINSSNYASNISNVLNINSSNYASNVSNVIITNTNATYLKLIGGTLTGDLTGTNITGTKVNCADASGVNAACLARLLNVVGTNAIMRIWRNDGTNSPAMEFLSGPTTSGTSYTKIWDMGIGGTTGTNFFYIRDRKPPSTSLNRLIIDDSGNVGIGTTTNASYRLNIEGSLNTTSINTTGNIACGGGMSLVGADAFYNPGSVTATNRTNTFLSFRGTGIGNDWAYLRNIGGDETIKLALDFHDDNDDARFCIRCVQSAGAEPDNIVEVFTVDNANTNINGNLSVATTIFANGDKLNFPNVLNQYKINLWGTNNYGFGITGGTLMYSSSQYHRFYNSGNNVNTVQFDDVGNVNMNGALSVGTTASIGGATNIGGLLRHRQSFNYGETVSYEIGYNGSPGLDGWWWTTNGFWAGYGTASYLTIAVNATSVSAVWFGRAYLSGTGGTYSVVQDYRSPDNNNTNQITVTNQWGANGANAMRITILNANYGGTFIIKVSG
jgi:hypothetical protein